MNLKYIIAASLALGIASPAIAQDASGPGDGQTVTVAAGTTVYGSDGAAIGTVAQASGNTVVLDVDGQAVPIPGAAIASGDNGATINITKADLMARFEEQKAAFDAELNAALTAGAAVQTADGQALGTVQETSSEAVLVESSDGPITLPRQLITLDNQGALIVRATMDQIRQALAAQPEQG